MIRSAVLSAAVVALVAAAAATPVVAQPAPPAGPAVTPNAGPVTGKGGLTDSGGGALGTWSIDAVLKDGDFTGSATVTIKGATLTLPLKASRSFLENGKCYFYGEEGRARVEIGGPCTQNGVSGRLEAFIPQNDIYSVTGFMQGSLAFGRAGAGAKAATAAVLPTNKLTCAWMERIGGNVAGDLARYELRNSNMATLTLTPGGTYRTANASGAFKREGDTIRLTSGQFAGAVGRLQPDRSGRPAVYFEIAENRRANGVHIVDPARTSCTTARGG
jgi:hypothetical protein